MPTFKFPTDLTYVKEASRKVLDFLSDSPLDETALFDIKLCFEEAFINAVKYGNKQDSHLSVDVDIVKTPGNIEIIVCDQGKGFDFKRIEDPTNDENLIKTCGRGLFLIKKQMDRVQFKRNGSCIHMTKKLKGTK